MCMLSTRYLLLNITISAIAGTAGLPAWYLTLYTINQFGYGKLGKHHQLKINMIRLHIQFHDLATLKRVYCMDADFTREFNYPHVAGNAIMIKKSLSPMNVAQWQILSVKDGVAMIAWKVYIVDFVATTLFKKSSKQPL